MEIGAKRRLERKARPRSGSPDLDVVILALVNIIISTTDCIDVFTVSTIVVSFRVTSTGSTSSGCIVVGASFVTIIGDSVGGEFTSESSNARVGVQTLPHSTARR